jgi:hypothetical protein
LKAGSVVCVFKKIQSREYFKLFRQKTQFAGQTPRALIETPEQPAKPFRLPYWWLKQALMKVIESKRLVPRDMQGPA